MTSFKVSEDYLDLRSGIVQFTDNNSTCLGCSSLSLPNTGVRNIFNCFQAKATNKR